MDSGGGTSAIVKTRKFKKTPILNIATWNVRTLLDSQTNESITIPRRTALVAREIVKYNIDIATLQETHLPGFGRMDEKKSGYTYFWSGSDSDENNHGVAICTKTSLIKKGIVSEPTCINERLMSINIMERNSKSILICCYAPTEVATDLEKNKFYADLEKIIKNTPKKYNIILSGDLNARIGQDHKQWPQIIGSHGPDKNINDNGQRLLNLCAQEGLCIPITWFQQMNKRKTTWRHPRSHNWHMIDYIIVRSQRRKDVLRCRVLRGAECGTDHQQVRASIVLKPFKPPKKTETSPRFDSKSLKNEVIKNKFQERIAENINLDEHRTVT